MPPVAWMALLQLATDIGSNIAVGPAATGNDAAAAAAAEVLQDWDGSGIGIEGKWDSATNATAAGHTNSHFFLPTF